MNQRRSPSVFGAFKCHLMMLFTFLIQNAYATFFFLFRTTRNSRFLDTFSRFHQHHSVFLMDPNCWNTSRSHWNGVFTWQALPILLYFYAQKMMNCFLSVSRIHTKWNPSFLQYVFLRRSRGFWTFVQRRMPAERVYLVQVYQAFHLLLT